MQMRRLQLFIVAIILAGCNNHDKTIQSTVIKSYDTLSNGLRIINTLDSPFYYKDQVGTDSLLGNYQVCYTKDDSFYYLYLKHHDSLVLLNKTSRNTSLHHLGEVTNDDTVFFILGHDNGNGAPGSFEYIDKQTGKNPLGFGIEFLDFRKLNNTVYLLFADTVTHNRPQLTLFNTSNREKEFYESPNDFLELFIDTLTNKNLRIRFTVGKKGDTTKTKMYSR